MMSEPAYTVETGEQDGREVVVLRSSAADMEATFVPKLGMIGSSLKHQGEELLALPGGLDKYEREHSTMGIPFLYPWAGRLSGYEYTVGDVTVKLDPDSPLIHKDSNGLPMHGVLAASPYWEVREVAAHEDGAVLVAELDWTEHDDLMACFPFPHVVRQDVRLEGNALTIQTTVTPTSDVAVPISFGFHPYLRIPGVPREEWLIDLPVTREILVDDRGIPTGETRPVKFELEALGERSFDDGYEGLISGRPFVVEGGNRRVALSMLEGYSYAQVFSPTGAEFMCFEPMTSSVDSLRGGRGGARRRLLSEATEAFRFDVRAE